MVANTCEADRVGIWAVANASPTEVTLFLSNLTAECTRSQLTKWMDSHGCMEGCDYLFVPRNFQTGASLGYGFANFVDPASADRLVKSAHGTAMRVAISTDQGLVANVVKWASGRVNHVRDPENLPFVRALDAVGVKRPVMAAFQDHGPAVEEVPAPCFPPKRAAAGGARGRGSGTTPAAAGGRRGRGDPKPLATFNIAMGYPLHKGAVLHSFSV
ncbi:unnamed protein product [Prorocentrum cordatum]|uniref:RRM domain-containing protein n=1 Tax=Prorocentrum cordatum TaxID=2364126 RepID=A0ABN9YEN4_9DINO|nr:unnamed protein product [Polarella glacialis]